MIHNRHKTGGRKSESGFTMIELMVTMVAFVFVIAAASQMLTGLLTQFKQQSKIAETNIEGAVGLNILRQDIYHAGMGLPWNVTGIADSNADGVIDFSDNVPGYIESSVATYNDAPNNPPSAFKSGDGAGAGGDDYLVIKSAAVSSDLAAGKNTRLTWSSPYVRAWSSYLDDLKPSDRAIVLSPGSTDFNARTLIVTGGTYNALYNNISSYAPADSTDVRLVYGISSANTSNSLRAPFNRADYYIVFAGTPAISIPSRCAAGTGVLVRATLNQDTASSDFTETPILDCVADMQVVYALDNNESGDFQNGVGGDAYSNSIAGLPSPVSEKTRERVREVQVYILAHEGQRDPNFTFSNFTGACSTCVMVGQPGGIYGRDYDLSGLADYTDFRWKVYSISVSTDNLR